jgi:hypothetical protein
VDAEGELRRARIHRAWIVSSGRRTSLSATKIRVENINIRRTLAEKMRIMAAMPQFPRRESNKQRKKESRHIKEMAWPAGFS